MTAGLTNIRREEYFEIEGVQRDVPNVTSGASPARSHSVPEHASGHDPGLHPARSAADRLSGGGLIH
jgi:hypothetical protein